MAARVHHLKDFEHLRYSNDRYLNYLTQECIEMREKLLDKDSQYRQTIGRYRIGHFMVCSGMALLVMVLFHFSSYPDRFRMALSVACGTVSLGVFVFAGLRFVRELEQWPRKMLRQAMDFAVEAVSCADPCRRVRDRTSLTANQELDAAYDDLLAVMRPVAIKLGPSYLWKDPAIAEMERALK